MNNLRIPVMMALLALVLSAGCDGQWGLNGDSASSQSQGDLVLMPEPNPPIGDVPVPIYFKLDEGRSRNYAAGNARYVDHVYRGSGNKYEVRDFYLVEMGRYGWICVGDRATGGVLTLHFDKGTERCAVVISGRYDLFRPTEIHLEMWTTGRLPSPPTETP